MTEDEAQRPPPPPPPAAAPQEGLFSVRTGRYRGAPMLNMCDAELVGTVVEDAGGGGGGGPDARPARRMPIKASYYGGKTVGGAEAAGMLAEAKIINIAGSRSVDLAVGMGLGIRKGTRVIGGVPFLIVFR